MPESKARAILEVQVTGVNQGNNAVKGFQDNVTRSMTASEKSVASAIGGMIAQYASLAVAVQKAAKVMSSGIEFNKFVENQTMSFGVMMKSMSAAKEQMKDLYNFAVNSPLTFKETAGSAKQLMAYGFAAKELVPTMETLGSVAIATGNRLDDIAYVYGTLRSQGRAYSRDLMQFGMRGIPIYEELGKVMGVTSDKIQKLASQGKIGFKEVEKAFKNMTSSGGKFAGILDGYMETLTGKLSMFGDIAEQSAGKLMEPTTAVLKDTVENLTKAFQSSGFQSTVKSVGEDIGLIAKALATVLEVVVAMLPALTLFVKLWVTFIGLKLVKNVLVNIPGLLFNIADGLFKGTTALATFASGGAAFGSAMSMSFATATASLKAFAVELWALIAANPWLIGAAAVGAIAVGAGVAMSKAHERNKESANPNIRANELMKEYATKAYSATEGGSTAILQAEDVKKIADEYQLAEGTTARILINAGALAEASWKTYINNKSATQALEEYKKVQEGLKHTTLTMEQSQMKFLGELNNLPADRYEDLSNIDLNALGGKGANDYIAGFAEARKREKDIFGIAYSKDQLKDSLTTEYKALQEALTAGADVPGLFNTTYDEKIRARLVQINKELEGMGGAAKKIKDINIEKWWAPIVEAAKVSLTPFDDIQVAQEMAIFNARKEYQTRMDNYDLAMSQASSEAEALELQRQKTADMLLMNGYIKDITKEYEKQKNLTAYNIATGGNEAYWEDQKATVGAGYRSGDYAGAAYRQASVQILQGTEVGNIQSAGEGGTAAMFGGAVTAFTTMISSVENVGKVLNPFATMFESAKAIIEPLLNNALKPLVQILTQIGTVVGKILSPLIGIIKIVTVIAYVAFTPLLAVLQIVGNAFMWLYDYVIVPFGNVVIAVANGIIGVLNTAFGWLGVNIEYIDALETSTEALKDFSKLIENMKSSLDQTIDYLTDKINDAVDKQLSSLQDLYEVGAITASDYERQAVGLNAQKISSDDVLVSAMDKAITSTAEMYNRLYALYDLKDVLENTEGLTEKQQAKLLKDAGLNSTSMETAMKNAVFAALTAYGASKTGTDINATGMTTQNKIDAAQKSVDEAMAQMQRYRSAIQNDQNAINMSLGLNFGARSDKASHQAELEKWLAVYAQAQAELAALQSGGLAVGTPNVPQDMLTTVHKKEGIIPATFMDGIRSGELSLSGGNNRGGESNITVVVNVAGSVKTENDLTDAIAQNLFIRRKQGLLTV